MSGQSNQTVTGTGFLAGATAYLDGAALTTVVNSSVSLTVTFPESVFWPTTSFGHTRSLTVANSGSAQSTAATMTVVVPAVVDDAYRGDKCTTVSGAVSAAAGIFGTGHDLSQATAGNRPTYNAAGFNGLPTWDGGGTKYLQSSSFAISQPFGYLLVHKQNTYASGKLIIGASGGTGFGSVYMTGTQNQIGFAAGVFQTGYAVPTGTWISKYTKFNGASGGMTINNKYSTAAISAGTNSFATGFALMASSGGGSNADISVAELWVLKGTPSATFLAQFQKYVDYRYWNLANNTATRQVVCHGDSRTYGVGADTSYPIQLGMMLGSAYNVVNGGVSGADAPACISNFSVKVTANYDSSKTKNIYILDIGVNDFHTGRTSAQLKADRITLLGMARSAGFNWCIENPFAAGVFAADATATRDALETQRVDYQTNFWNTTGGDNYPTLDTNLNSQAATANTTYYADLLHEKTAGYTLVANAAVAGVLAAG